MTAAGSTTSRKLVVELEEKTEARATQERHVALLVDISGSMQVDGKAEAACDGLRRVANKLQPRVDQVALHMFNQRRHMMFGMRPVHLIDWQRARKVMDSLNGQTALLDSIHQCLEEFQGMQASHHSNTWSTLTLTDICSLFDRCKGTAQTVRERGRTRFGTLDRGAD